MVFTICIAHVLLADILALQRCTESLVVIAKLVVQNEVWRESDMRVTLLSGPLFAPYPLVFIKSLGKIFHTVLAQRGIDVPCESAVQLDASHEFHTHTVALRHICRYRFAYFVGCLLR